MRALCLVRSDMLEGSAALLLPVAAVQASVEEVEEGSVPSKEFMAAARRKSWNWLAFACVSLRICLALITAYSEVSCSLDMPL